MKNSAFTRTKVKELTLGERLQELRQSYHVSLTELSRQTKIQKRYLQALEAGHYDDMPAEVYVRGFIHAYESYFHVPQDTFTKSFEREYQIFANMHHEPETKQKQKKGLGQNLIGVTVTARHIFIAMTLFGVLGVGGYVTRGIVAYMQAPLLTVMTPSSGETTKDAIIGVTGATHPQAFLYINNIQTPVSSRGQYAAEVGLKPGENAIEITSESSSGSQTSRKITVFREVVESGTPEVVNSKENITKEGGEDGEVGVIQERGNLDDDQSDVSSANNVSLELRALADGVWITVAVDGEEVLRETWEKGVVRDYIGEKAITVTASPGNQVEVTHNGVLSGLLGKGTAIVREKKYLPEGSQE